MNANDSWHRFCSCWYYIIDERGEGHAQSLDGAHKDNHRINVYSVSDDTYGYNFPLISPEYGKPRALIRVNRGLLIPHRKRVSISWGNSSSVALRRLWHNACGFNVESGGSGKYRGILPVNHHPHMRSMAASLRLALVTKITSQLISS